MNRLSLISTALLLCQLARDLLRCRPEMVAINSFMIDADYSNHEMNASANSLNILHPFQLYAQ